MIVLLIIAMILTFVPQANAQTQKLVRIYIENPQQAEELLTYDLDFASHRFRRFADVVITEEEERMLLQRGFSLETLIADLKRSFQARFGGRTNMGAYHTYQEMYEEMFQIANDHPDITLLTSIGQSIEGRDIWAMKVSDQPSLEENDEQDLLFMANMHAREVVTPEVVLYFLNYLVSHYGTDPDVTNLVDHREFWLIPTQNPDGHVYVENVDPWWRKNRRNNGSGYYGVDLNRNYSYMWGFDDTGSSPYPWSETYRGPGPFSEPESQAIHELSLTHNFVLALSFHSYGRLWLFPWGYIPENTPHHEIFTELARNCVAFNGYRPGNPANGTIYITNGDTDDYFYGEQSEKNIIFSFTPEVGDEFWPPESQIPILSEENLQPMLYLAQIAPIIEDNPWRLLPPATPVMDPISGIQDGDYALSWSIEDDPNNPAILFQLDELSGYTTLTDDAENGDVNWNLDGFAISSARFHSSSQSFYSGQGDNLDRNMTTVFPLIVADGSALIFWAWYDIETHWDYAYVEISTDGGITFNSIPGNITTNSNPNGNNLGNGITGSSGGWIQGIFDLSDYSGQTILVRFRYVTDEYTAREGFYVDDIFPVPNFESVVTLADDISDTVYAISGQEDGVYYYRVRAKDGEDQWGGWSALEDVVVQTGAITYHFPQAGWYLISLPVHPPDNALQVLFPTAIAAFGWDSATQGYLPADSLETQKGYWLAIPSPTTATIAGSPLNAYTEHYTAGWHLIGAVRDSVDFSDPNDDPDGSIAAAFAWDPVAMQYTMVYPMPPGSGVLSPLEGYWILAMEECDLTIESTLQRTDRKVSGRKNVIGLDKKFRLTPPSPPTFSFEKDDQASPPKNFALLQNYPNPFNAETVIEYRLPENGRVNLEVFTLLGQEVRNLVKGQRSAGVYRIQWDGRNDVGQKLESGIYLYRLRAGSFVQTRKLILTK